MTLKITALAAITTIICFTQCNQPQSNTNTSSGTVVTTKSRTPVSYHAVSMKDSGMAKFNSYDTSQQQLILAINRIDKKHVSKLDTLIMPDNMRAGMLDFSPFPPEIPYLNGVSKIIFFSYPAEAFGAYEHGKLVRWGATNMGREKDPTPNGLTYVNWKKEVDTSSVKDEWILKWNVNILNKGGVGFHEYAMPGYPVSHSCLRLMDNDAAFLYNWVDQWILKDADQVLAHGTPVVVFGNYPFGGPKPWLALLQNSKALDINADDIKSLIAPNLQQILSEQQKLTTAMSEKAK